MEELITGLLSAPVSTVLVVGGIILLCLAVVSQFVAGITVLPERQKWAGIIGAILVFSGVVIYVANLLIQPPPTPTPTTTEPVVSVDTVTPTSTLAPTAPLAPTDTATAAPTSTSTPVPIATDTPTSTAIPCAYDPTGSLGAIWERDVSVQNRLHCPMSEGTETDMGEQSFEHGKMFWREDMTLIYVMYDNERWQSFLDTWRDDDAPYSCDKEPPSGFSQPQRGFGKVWCEQPGVSEGLGWAIVGESPMRGTVLDFEGGVMFDIPEGIFILYSQTASTGTWEER
jgi:hypothetical protein